VVADRGARENEVIDRAAFCNAISQGRFREQYHDNPAAVSGLLDDHGNHAAGACNLV